MYKKFTLLDDSTRPDHYYITPNDSCVYYGEYTATRGYNHSETNQLISNLKAPINAANRAYYKRKSISLLARVLKDTIPSPQDILLVPVPPSKAKSDPLYDNRMVAILEEYKRLEPSVEYRELVLQVESTNASHESTLRHSPDDLIKNYRIDESQIHNIRPTIVIFDDMLTAGSHFKAMQSIITSRFPQHRIGGLFIARRVFWAEDPEFVFSALENA